MNQRDLELLSTYLDGQLSPSDSTRLAARLKTDPELASALNDLRATRVFLRKLPQRRAPRNFTLTRKMVGQNPPLPRAYPLFRFATALATLLFIFSFGVNTFGREMASQTLGFGRGGGGGGDSATEESVQLYSAPAAAAPAATQAPAATEAPLLQMAPVATQLPSTEDNTIAETPAAKSAGDTANAVNPNQPPAPGEAQKPAQSLAPLVPSLWQVVLAAIAIASALLMVLMRQFSARRWK